MLNIKQIIRRPNEQLLNSVRTQPANNKTCNCRIPKNFSLKENCLKKSLAYQAVVTTTNNTKPAESYVRLTDNTF